MSPTTLYINKSVLMIIRKCIFIVILVAFVGTSIKTPAYAQAAQDQMLRLPAPGVMVHLSPEFNSALLKGIIIHPENALKFDFIVENGDTELSDQQKNAEYTRLIKYFLASLAVPDEDQWVNLSPYEKDRIIKEDFGKTGMGRDLLSEDYILKQITASLVYPEDSLGKKFWNKIYSQAYKQLGTTDIPVSTFNKVWIVPDSAEIFEKGNAVFLIKSHLKVMLEEDYLSLKKHNGIQSISNNIPSSDQNKAHTIASKVVKEIVIPLLETEVNEGKNFANLRQAYSGMILAAWYKRALKESLLGRIYDNRSRLKGVDQDPKNNEMIYQRYLRAYKKGVFNFIKEDVDKYTNETIPRKYFSGGVVGPMNFTRIARMLSAKIGLPAARRVLNNFHTVVVTWLGEESGVVKAISRNAAQLTPYPTSMTFDQFADAINEARNDKETLDRIADAIRRATEEERFTIEQEGALLQVVDEHRGQGLSLAMTSTVPEQRALAAVQNFVARNNNSDRYNRKDQAVDSIVQQADLDPREPSAFGDAVEKYLTVVNTGTVLNPEWAYRLSPEANNAMSSFKVKSGVTFLQAMLLGASLFALSPDKIVEAMEVKTDLFQQLSGDNTLENKGKLLAVLEFIRNQNSAIMDSFEKDNPDKSPNGITINLAKDVHLAWLKLERQGKKYVEYTPDVHNFVLEMIQKHVLVQDRKKQQLTEASFVDPKKKYQIIPENFNWDAIANAEEKQAAQARLSALTNGKTAFVINTLDTEWDKITGLYHQSPESFAARNTFLYGLQRDSEGAVLRTLLESSQLMTVLETGDRTQKMAAIVELLRRINVGWRLNNAYNTISDPLLYRPFALAEDGGIGIEDIIKDAIALKAILEKLDTSYRAGTVVLSEMAASSLTKAFDNGLEDVLTEAVDPQRLAQAVKENPVKETFSFDTANTLIDQLSVPSRVQAVGLRVLKLVEGKIQLSPSEAQDYALEREHHGMVYTWENHVREHLTPYVQQALQESGLEPSREHEWRVLSSFEITSNNDDNSVARVSVNAAMLHTKRNLHPGYDKFVFVDHNQPAASKSGKTTTVTAAVTFKQLNTVAELESLLPKTKGRLIALVAEKDQTGKKFTLRGTFDNAALVRIAHHTSTPEALYGGIDFNAANLNLQIKRDGKGVPLPISQQDWENIHIDGLIPVILNVKPAITSPLLSQLQATGGQDQA